MNLVRSDSNPGDLKVASAAAHLASATLTELAADYAFVHHFLLFHVIPLANDPLNMFVQKRGQPLLLLRLNKSIIADLPEPFDRQLLAIAKDEFDVVARELDSFAVISRSKGFYGRLLCQDLPLVDVQGLAKFSGAPPLYVRARFYGVDTTEACWYYKPPFKPMSVEPLRILRGVPEQATLKRYADLVALGIG